MECCDIFIPTHKRVINKNHRNAAPIVFCTEFIGEIWIAPKRDLFVGCSER